MLEGQLETKSAMAENQTAGGFEPFGQMLCVYGLQLRRDQTHTLQVNVGLLCNQTCRHCHLNAGPARFENMGVDTLDEVVAYAQRSRFETIDITGGAPELNPHIIRIVEMLAAAAPRLMFRTNLSALNDGKRGDLMELLKKLRAVIIASFPALNVSQTDSQRGDGMFRIGIDELRKLNALGYGHSGSGLELNLVSNPTGAFLPPSQAQTEKRFRRVLSDKYGIVFNSLFNFANVPLGRFRRWLVQSGNFQQYIQKLASSFNPCALTGVMCRTLVSVSWDGYLYDCDFNLAAALPMGRRKVHVSEMPGPPEEGSPIAFADHCYTCTAGSGFT